MRHLTPFPKLLLVELQSQSLGGMMSASRLARNRIRHGVPCVGAGRLKTCYFSNGQRPMAGGFIVLQKEKTGIGLSCQSHHILTRGRYGKELKHSEKATLLHTLWSAQTETLYWTKQMLWGSILSMYQAQLTKR